MNRDEAIAISDDDDEAFVSRRAILEPAVKNVVDALGGHEDGRYRLGDECYGCLKDLKRLWRKDDTDDERTVARIFWETRVLPNDLVPILLETAGKGVFDDKHAIACTDLMTAMTWPIDMAEELKELDEEFDKGTDYTQLLQSHLHYKAALLRPGIMEALFGIVLSALGKDTKSRTDRDVQVVGVVLYLVRNLAFIKDLPANMNASADQAELSSLQTKLIQTLSQSHVLDLVLTIASNSDSDPMFNGWNTLVLEIIYLLFRGVKPTGLVTDQSKEPTQNLRRLLAVEDKRKRDIARNASSRHSRFGTTISVTLNPKHKANVPEQPAEGQVVEVPPESEGQAFVLHRQQALKKDTGTMFDALRTKKGERFRGAKKVDDVAIAGGDNLSMEARQTLQEVAKMFLETSFNALLASLLKDIRAERPKITEKDHLRLLFVTKWFLEFFVSQRNTVEKDLFGFGLVAEVTERGWIVWVLRRMRQAVSDKPKAWTELQAGVECLTQLVMLIESMLSSDDPSVADTAELLQIQIVYNGEVLDISFDSLKSYKGGVQSLAYLESSVNLAYVLLRRLEKYSRQEGASYVRKKTKKARAKKVVEDGGVPDVEEEVESEEEVVKETTFTFDQFEQQFAHPFVTETLLAYLARYKEFTSAENMKRVVNLLHRQAVKAKAEGLFFRVSTLELFKTILEDQKSLPRDQPYKDLVNLMNFLIRKFFKAVAEDQFLIVEAFYPKTRGKWKALSSWEPPEKGTSGRRRADDSSEDEKRPREVRVKKGYSWSENVGIIVKALVDSGKRSLVDWVRDILAMAAAIRQRIVDDIDGSSSKAMDVDDDDENDSAALQLRNASMDAVAKFTDFMIPYVDDAKAQAANKDPHLRCLFKELSFAVKDDDAEELEWYIPQAIVPQELRRNLQVITQYLENPIDLEGKNAAQLLHKKPRRRRRRRAAESSDDEDGDNDDEPRRKRREKKKKEDKHYKSAQFIEDSDMEPDELEAFLAKEKALREKMAIAATETGTSATMRHTGTRKRRRRENARGSKRPKLDNDAGDTNSDAEAVHHSDKADESGDDSEHAVSPKPSASPRQPTRSSSATIATSPEGSSAPRPAVKPRPKPRPRTKPAVVDEEDGEDALDEEALKSLPPPSSPTSTVGSRATSPLVISSDEENAPVVPRKVVHKRRTIAISDEE